MQPIDILEMAKTEMSQKKLICELVDRLRLLKNDGKSNNEIFSVIENLNLPLGLHLYITGNFSNLMRYGVNFRRK